MRLLSGVRVVFAGAGFLAAVFFAAVFFARGAAEREAGLRLAALFFGRAAVFFREGFRAAVFLPRRPVARDAGFRFTALFFFGRADVFRALFFFLVMPGLYIEPGAARRAYTAPGRRRHERSDMKVILFGATGMVGQGVLRECLIDPDVSEVLSVGRTPAGRTHPKLREIVRRNLSDLSGIETELSGFDACFFCLGVSSAGLKEPDYRRVTFDLTLGAARILARLNPAMTFIYVSGAGTDGTGRGAACGRA